MEEAEVVALATGLAEQGCGELPIAKWFRISYTKLCMAPKSYICVAATLLRKEWGSRSGPELPPLGD